MEGDPKKTLEDFMASWTHGIGKEYVTFCPYNFYASDCEQVLNKLDELGYEYVGPVSTKTMVFRRKHNLKNSDFDIQNTTVSKKSSSSDFLDPDNPPAPGENEEWDRICAARELAKALGY